ncbi:FecR family protein [Microbacter margulisiae]|uniref:Ferric-dicitrate binding protein FerR (Iron transport regulator) n=1 Tax=Microbacter margulisiae TaxID=1350067 RepID=A0A7W5DTP8_9PORP|nr:FecR domain-containing protein [Microbacter margulisiae]MBB3188528.1 ferric-dicitrate binding protein FerR (iron transport regulator) [Microbacter margulisiae]
MQKEEYIIDELIAKWLSKEIGAEEKQFLLQWIQESAENKAYFDQMKNIWQISHPAFHPASIDTEQAMSNVMNRIETRKWTKMPVIVWWQRIAAILLLPILLIAGYVLTTHPLPYNNQPTAMVYQEISSPFGVTSKINLPDGSVVWLNSGSKLKFPIAFVGKERNVYLSGEAYFQVHSDKQHPFIVETKHLNVTATGTQFDVESYSSDTIISVTLIKGVVNVNMGKNQKIILHPSQHLVFNAISNQYNKMTTDIQEWELWKDGILAFREEPLGEVFKRIGRAFNVDIIITDASVARQPYRATFKNESLDEILQLLQQTAPIQYKVIGRNNLGNNYYSKEKIEVLKAN